MTPQTAEKLVNAYGGALAVGYTGTARPISLLPASKARVRYAFYVYIAELVKRNVLTEDIGNNLVGSYCHIDSFIDNKKAEKFNKIAKQMEDEVEAKAISKIDTEEKREYMDFIRDAYGSPRALTEISDYIRECQTKIGN